MNKDNKSKNRKKTKDSDKTNNIIDNMLNEEDKKKFNIYGKILLS